MANKINPQKLMLSKWTAVEPTNKERHFIVTKLFHDENNAISHCRIEAIINHNNYQIEWQQLRNSEAWLMGWK